MTRSPSSGKPPELLFDLAIIKRDLTVKLAAHVREGDIEGIALRRPYSEKRV
jgi:hypothetical protein